MNEEFKIIKDFENYSISNIGRLKNNNSNRILKTFIAGSGYEYCRIINEFGHKKITIHNLVAKEFLGVRPFKFDVDHIDRNKLNNNVINLRYVSRSENQLNKNVSCIPRINKKDEFYNIKTIKKNDIITGYSIVIKNKYYGYYINLEHAIIKRDEIISTLNI